MTHVNPVVVQTNFRGREDSGNEATATWIADTNIDWAQDVDVDFRVRFEVDETATSSSPVPLDPQLRYELNGTGGFLAVTASTPIQYSTFTGASDGDATTQQIGSGLFVASELDSDGIIGASSIQGSGTETEWCLTIDSAQVANTDTIVLRVFNTAAALDTYSNEPTITVNESGAQDLTPALVVTEESFPAATVTRGAVDISPDALMASEESFFGPQVDLVISAALMATEEAFFGPTLTVGAVTLTPGLTATEESFPAPVITTGAVDLAPALVAAEEAFFGGVVAQDGGEQFLIPSLLIAEEEFFAPSVGHGLTAGLVSTEEAFPVATVAPGSVDLTPGLSATEEAFPVATVTPGVVTLFPQLVVTEESFSAPTVTVGAVTLTTTLVVPEEAFFGPTVANALTFRQNVNRTFNVRRGPSASANRNGAIVVRRSGAITVER